MSVVKFTYFVISPKNVKMGMKSGAGAEHERTNLSELRS